MRSSRNEIIIDVIFNTLCTVLKLILFIELLETLLIVRCADGSMQFSRVDFWSRNVLLLPACFVAAAANMFFICLFTIESLVKVYSVGFECYFASMFNRFDTFVIIFSWSEAALIYYDIINPVGVSVLRCARLLRVFKVTRCESRDSVYTGRVRNLLLWQKVLYQIWDKT